MSFPEGAVLSSRNPHKARELEALLPGWTIEPLDRDDYPPETGATYYDNARAARLASAASTRTAGCSRRTRASRWTRSTAAPASTRLATRPKERRRSRSSSASSRASENRSARYVSELVLLAPDGRGAARHGNARGRIATEPRGSEGFGYDPVFVPNGEERTVAELGDDWKAQNSHRAEAARALLRALEGA